MAGDTNIIEILINARNNAGQAIAGAVAQLTALESRMDKLGKSSDKASDSLDDVGDSAKNLGNKSKDISTFTKSLTELNNSVIDISKSTQKADKDLNNLTKNTSFHKLGIEAQQAAAQIEKLSRSLRNKDLGQNERAVIGLQILDLVDAHKEAFDKIGLDTDEFINKNIAKYKDEGRERIKIQADIENQVSKITSDALKGREQSVRLSLSKIADLEKELRGLGASPNEVGALRQDSFSNALKGFDKDKASSLVKIIRDMKGATEEESHSLSDLGDAADNAARDLSKIERQIKSTSNGLAALGLNARGLKIAFEIKYAQALTTALSALAGELTEVAFAGVNAGAAIGGALAAGASQAIGPLALLAGVVSRITAIGKVLSLRQTIQSNSLGQAQTNAKKAAGGSSPEAEADRQANALDTLTGAQESLKNSQIALTKARQDATQKLRDLVDAEQKAALAARGSSLSLEDSERKARAALATGSASDVAEANLGVDQARFDKAGSFQDLNQTRSQLASAAKAGVNGSEGVLQARKQLADATRALDRAERGMAASSRAASSAQLDEASTALRLKELLSQLSPAEQDLYKNVIKLQDVYKKAFRPITDTIIGAFSGAIDQVIPLFKDKRLLGSFQSVADQIAGAIGRITKNATGKTGFFEFFNSQSAKNIPQITQILINLSDAFLNIAKAGAPLFKFILDTVTKLSEKFEIATQNSAGLDQFFKGSKDSLKAVFDLISAIFGVFTSIFSIAQDEGTKSIEDLAKKISSIGDNFKNNQGDVRSFFQESRTVFNSLISIVVALARQIVRAFDPSTATNFADFLKAVIIPAIGNAIIIIGQMVKIFHSIFDRPLFSQAAQFVVTLAAVGKSIEILANAFKTLRLIALSFFASSSEMIPLVRGIGLAAAAVTVFSKYLGSAKDAVLAVGGAAIAVFGGIWLVQTAKALTGLTSLSKAILEIRDAELLAEISNPVTAIIGGLALLGTALIGFGSSQKKATKSTQDLVSSLQDQIDAQRQLRDGLNDIKDANLAAKSAALGVKEAEQNLTRVRKDAHKSGGVSDEEATAIHRASIELQQARQDAVEANQRKTDTIAAQPGKEASTAKGTREQIKNTRDTISADKDAIGKTTEKIKILEKLRQQNGDVAGTTDEIRKAQEKLSGQEEKLKADNKILAGSIKVAGDAWANSSSSANDFGGTVFDVMSYLGGEFNKLASGLGVKTLLPKIKAFVPKTKTTVAGAVKDLIPGLAGGGIIPGQGLQDNQLIMAAPGEGILNRHQMPVVDWALRASGAMQGGLNQLWSQISTPHYMAKGGAVNLYGHPGNIGGPLRSLIGLMEGKFPGLSVTATTDGTHVPGSYHYKGEAVDMAGSAGLMRAASEYVKSSGLYKKLLEGIHNPNLGVKNGQLVNGSSVFSSVWAGHANHIHLAIAGAIGKLIGGIGGGSISGMKIIGAGGLGSLARAMQGKVLKAANKFLDKQSGGVFDSEDDSLAGGKGSLSREQVDRLRKSVGLPPIFTNIAYAESAFNPNDINSIGATGLWQILQSAHPDLVAKYSPLTLPINNARAAKELYDARRANGQSGLEDWYASRNQGAGGGWGQFVDRHSRGGGILPFLGSFMKGGFIPREGMAHLHAGETVVPKFASGGVVGNIGSFGAASLGAFQTIINDIATINKNSSQSKIGKAMKAIRDLFADDGPFSILLNDISSLKTYLDQKIQGNTFKFNKDGSVSKVLDDVGVGAQNLTALKIEGNDIGNKLGAATTGLAAAKSFAQSSGANDYTDGQLNDHIASLTKRQTALIAKKKKQNGKLSSGDAQELSNINAGILNAKRLLQAKANVTSGQSTVDTLTGDLSQNASDQYNQVQSNEQLAFDNVTTAHQDISDKISIGSRIAAVLGNSQLPSDQLTLNNQTSQLGDLKNLLGQTTNPDVKKAIQKSIDDLTAGIAETAGKIVDDMLSDVDTAAAHGNAKASIQSRVGDLLAKGGSALIGASFAAKGSSLATTGTTLKAQRDAYVAILGTLDPNSEKAKALQDKIDDLNQSIDENTQSQKDNTSAFRTAEFNDDTSKTSFITGAATSVIGVIKSAAQLAGVPVNNGLIKNILTGSNSAIAKSDTNTQGLLAELLGYDPLAGLTGQDRLSALLGLSQMDTSNMTTDQQTEFRTYIDALLGNTQATIDNSEAIKELDNTNVQSFSSSAWQIFRTAIFNGSGGLLPDFANIPAMASGGMITKGGLFQLHAGEKVTPKSMVNDSNGDTHVYITNPTEVLDPTYIGAVLSYKRSVDRAS